MRRALREIETGVGTGAKGLLRESLLGGREVELVETVGCSWCVVCGALLARVDGKLPFPIPERARVWN